jgi:hypothetical protein
MKRKLVKRFLLMKKANLRESQKPQRHIQRIYQQKKPLRREKRVAQETRDPDVLEVDITTTAMTTTDRHLMTTPTLPSTCPAPSPEEAFRMIILALSRLQLDRLTCIRIALVEKVMPACPFQMKATRR